MCDDVYVTCLFSLVLEIVFFFLIRAKLEGLVVGFDFCVVVA